MRAKTHVRQANVSTRSVRPHPQQSRSSNRVDRLLEAAAEVIAEIGYESATTNAIAERAGVSIGSLYRYFPDKQAILRTLEHSHSERPSSSRPGAPSRSRQAGATVTPSSPTRRSAPAPRMAGKARHSMMNG
jgi:DNA-binding transcriptional regulator YbjK